MTQEQIETKCQDYSESATPSFINGTFERYAIAQAFEDGANWRINAVWHKPDEKPESNEIYLAQIGEQAFDTFYDSSNWESFSKGLNIIKWAYLKDLVPNE